MNDNKIQKKANVPTLRFPEFSGEWERKTLGEVGKFFSGGTPSSSNKEYYSGDIPFIRSGEIHESSTELMISQAGLDSSSAKIVEVGDVLMALYGATSGDIAISQIKGAINQAILCIRSNENKVFLTSVWQKHVQKILNTYLQGGQGNLSADIVKKIAFSFPSIDEQNKIGEFLRIIDERISIQNKIIEDLKKIKVGIENKCFGQNNGHKCSLSEILTERNERTTSNNQYEIISSTVNGLFSQREYFNKEVASSDNTGYKIIHNGDIVLSPQNLWMGNINFNDRFETGIVSPSYKVFSINEDFDKIYIASLMKSHRAIWSYSLVSEQGASIVRRNLNLDGFLNLTFSIPNIREQRKISRALYSLFQKLHHEEKYRDALLLQKKILLKQMFI